MSKFIKLSMVIILITGILPLSQGGAQAAAPSLVLQPPWNMPALPPNCTLGADANGSQTLICTPALSGYPLIVTLIVYAHGYVNPYFPPKQIPWDQMSILGDDGVTPVFLPSLVTNLGYYFAATSYRANGLVVQDAVKDLLLVRDLAVAKIRSQYRYSLINVVLAGVSEGGLITTLSLERYPAKYNAGLELCGPIGDFRMQVNYWGDFRTMFDAYYPDLLLPFGGDAVHIPDSLVQAWYNMPLEDKVLTALSKPLAETKELLDNAGVPYGPVPDAAVPGTMALSLIGVLDYNINATENARLVLSGNPFDNTRRNYPYSALLGSDLDALVMRYTASSTALWNMLKYETSGWLWRPMVAMHTTGDPIVPVSHMALYQAKVNRLRLGFNFKPLVIDRYGHCAFTQAEIMAGLGMLYKSTTGQSPVGYEGLLSEHGLTVYRELMGPELPIGAEEK